MIEVLIVYVMMIVLMAMAAIGIASNSGISRTKASASVNCKPLQDAHVI